MRDDRYFKKSSSMDVLMGVLVGTVIGVAATLLSDKKNRDMLIDRMDEFRKSSRDKVEELGDKVDEAKTKTQRELAKNLKKAGKRLDMEADRLS